MSLYIIRCIINIEIGIRVCDIAVMDLSMLLFFKKKMTLCMKKIIVGFKWSLLGSISRRLEENSADSSMSYRHTDLMASEGHTWATMLKVILLIFW